VRRNRPLSAQPDTPAQLIMVTSFRKRRFDLDQAAMISIKWQSVDLQPNAA